MTDNIQVSPGTDVGRPNFRPNSFNSAGFGDEFDSDSTGQEWNIFIPPNWWDEFINQQSKIVQCAFEYYNKPKYRDKQKELLIELLEFDPIDKNVWLSFWMDGKLNTHLLSFCQ